MTDSFFPAARRVLKSPVVRWVGGGLLTLVTAAMTTGVWPLFKGWVVSRASKDAVEEVSERVTKVEKEHQVDFAHLDSANGDDTSKLTQAEQLQWTIIRVKRLQIKLAAQTRYGVGLQAKLRMPKPQSDTAKRIAAAVRTHFDRLMMEGETDPNVAAQKALDEVFGSTMDEN